MLRKTLDNLPLSRPFLVVTAIAAIVFYPTWIRLAEAWLEFEQVLAHGLATALIFLGLLLIHPPQISDKPNALKPYHGIGALALIITTLTWALLELVRIDTLAYLMLPAGVVSTSWALLGLARTLSFIPYVLLLSLSLPIWADMVPALVELASIVVGTWVGWFGMTALIEGNSITLPYGRLLIADGCSGIRYFAISILLAMMTSILNDYRWRDWLITLVIAMILALIANWVRITILVVVAYETDMQSDLLTDHETMGWMVYAAFVLPALYFSPVLKRKQRSPYTQAAPPKSGFIAAFLALLIGPIGLTLINTAPSQQASWELQPPGSRSGEPENLPIPLSIPKALNAQAWQTGEVWVSVAQTQRKTADDKLVPYLPPLFDRSKWQQQSSGNGVTLYRNISTREQVAMAQWYQVGSYRSSSYRKAKLLQIPALIKGESQFALLSLQAACKQRSCQNARANIEARIKALQTNALITKKENTQ